MCNKILYSFISTQLSDTGSVSSLSPHAYIWLPLPACGVRGVVSVYSSAICGVEGKPLSVL